MTILIMNLLVGLAVDDIKLVQEQAVLKRMAMQVCYSMNKYHSPYFLNKFKSTLFQV